MALQVCICDEHLELSDGGVICVRPGAFGPRAVLTYLSSGFFRKAQYPWLARVHVKVQGGGGGSGASQKSGTREASAGGGGAGGGYSEALVEVANLDEVETVSVGAGGGVTAFAGLRGEDSFFGAHSTASGGGPGLGPGDAADSTALLASRCGEPGTGGRGTVGDVSVRGGDGQWGWAVGGLNLKKGGRGGNSRFAGGRAGRTSNGAGLPGRANTGEGASGATTAPGSAAHLGGAGGSGIVILELYG